MEHGVAPSTTDSRVQSDRQSIIPTLQCAVASPFHRKDRIGEPSVLVAPGRFGVFSNSKAAQSVHAATRMAQHHPAHLVNLNPAVLRKVLSWFLIDHVSSKVAV